MFRPPFPLGTKARGLALDAGFPARGCLTMTDLPKNEELRHPKPGVIDQRQQQIDPAGHFRVDPDVRPDANSKQPGGSVDREGGR